MVDFNNEATVATPPGEVVKIVVLERREQVIEALERYHQIGEEADAHHQVTIAKARLMALWYQIEAMVYRRLKDVKDPTYEEVEKAVCEARDFDEVVEMFKFFNHFIDDMGLTFIDGRERYDRRRVEDANSKKGL